MAPAVQLKFPPRDATLYARIIFEVNCNQAVAEGASNRIEISGDVSIDFLEVVQHFRCRLVTFVEVGLAGLEDDFVEREELRVSASLDQSR